MTKSTKNYRKFIAAAATATIVAGAVTPMAFAASFTDVEDRYQDAVEFLVSKGIKGTSDTTFGTQLNVKRVDAAVFVAKALELDTESAPDAGFTDVPNRAKGAVNALKAANITSGKTTTTFASDQEITRGELAIWLQRAFELKAGSEELVFTDVADRYEAAVKALVSNEITSGTSTTTFGTTDSAKRGDFALFIKRAVDATAVVDVEPAVEDVNAIDVNKIEVEFNKAVDTELVKVALKKGQATQYTTATFAEDKKSVILEAPSAIAIGDYEVVVTGLGEAEIKKPITIEAAVEKAIEINNTEAVKSATAKVTYKVANQYNTDMNVASNTTGFDVQAYNVTKDSKVDVAIGASSDFTLALDSAEIGDEVRVIITYKGITTTKTLKVVEAGKVTDVQLGSAVLPTDAKRFTVGATGVALPYTLKDQYGKEIKLTASKTNSAAIASADGVTFLSSDSDIVNPTTISTDADGKLSFNIGSKAGTVTLTAVINSTGVVATTTVKVEEASKVDAVTISAPSKLVAVGESVELDFVVTDQFGDTIKNDDSKVAALKPSSDDKSKVELVNGKLVVTANAAGSTTVKLSNGSTEVGEVTFTIEAAAAPTTITGVDVAGLYENNGKDTLTIDDITVKDQYGRDYELVTGDEVAVSAKDGSFDAVKIAGDTDEDENLDSTETFTFKGTTTYEDEVVVFELANGATFEATLASVATDDISSYSINTEDTIYAAGEEDKRYNVAVKLVGKTNDGKTVQLESNDPTSVTVSSTTILGIDGTKIFGLVAGEATVSAWLGTENVASKAITVSDEALVPTTIEISETETEPKTLSNIVVVKDQFGVAMDKKGTYLVDGEVKPASTELEAGSHEVTYIAENGVIKTVKVTVTISE